MSDKEMSDKVNLAAGEAFMALYFDDSSKYRRVLEKILLDLDPELYEKLQTKPGDCFQETLNKMDKIVTERKNKI